MTDKNNQALTVRSDDADTTIVGRQVALSGIEQAIVSGNLANISPEQRMSLYIRACQSIGLNPLTKPFEYLTLNNRMILYPTKAAAEQLRLIHRVSVVIMNRQRDSDLYIVTALATMPDGRRDTATGIVPIAGLKGVELANALMKAETKAKRRVTLSICGLSWLDEIDPDAVANAPRQDIDLREIEGEWKEPGADTTSTVSADPQQIIQQVQGLFENGESPIPMTPSVNNDTAEPDPTQPATAIDEPLAEENRQTMKAAGGPVNVTVPPNPKDQRYICEYCTLPIEKTEWEGKTYSPSAIATATKRSHGQFLHLACRVHVPLLAGVR